MLFDVICISDAAQLQWSQRWPLFLNTIYVESGAFGPKHMAIYTYYCWAFGSGGPNKIHSAASDAQTNHTTSRPHCKRIEIKLSTFLSDF
jgi:hypothetical protein